MVSTESITYVSPAQPIQSGMVNSVNVYPVSTESIAQLVSLAKPTKNGKITDVSVNLLSSRYKTLVSVL